MNKLVAAVLAGLCFLAAPVAAQQIKPLEVEIDPNGVDLLTGMVEPRVPELSIPAAPELTFRRLSDFIPILEGRVPYGGPTESVSYSVNGGMFTSDSFKCADSCVGQNGRGSAISGGLTSGPFYYTQGGTGKKITFTIQEGDQSPPAGGDIFYYLGTQISVPGQPSISMSYESGNPWPGNNTLTYRLKSELAQFFVSDLYAFKTARAPSRARDQVSRLLTRNAQVKSGFSDPGGNCPEGSVEALPVGVREGLREPTPYVALPLSRGDHDLIRSVTLGPTFPENCSRDVAELGIVGIQDSHLTWDVIHTLDGTLRTDRRPVGEDGTALSG